MTGPKADTITDFWRLVWQERPPTIVMLTNLREHGHVKCNRYWPEAQCIKVGPFVITLTEAEFFADYCIRTLIIEVSGSL